MALFKRPDASYIVGVHTLHEGDEINHFLEYRDGKWIDISPKVIPEFSTRNVYELPRYGTTIAVTNSTGVKIYELLWSNGRFVVKR